MSLKLLHFIVLSLFLSAPLSLSLHVSLPPGQKDRGWRVWRDLRGAGPADTDQRGVEGGVSSAAKTGAEDGGGRAEEAPG